MAKDTGKKPSRKKLLDAARKHQDALTAAGLPESSVERYATALAALEQKGPNAAAQVLVKEIQREAGEIQAAVRKEFPGNAGFQSIFKAGEPLPQAPREVLALGALVATQAPEFAQNLIKYAINAATVKHLASLCAQLEKELGGRDPETEARELEARIGEAAGRAFEGKPELGQFQPK